MYKLHRPPIVRKFFCSAFRIINLKISKGGSLGSYNRIATDYNARGKPKYIRLQCYMHYHRETLDTRTTMRKGQLGPPCHLKENYNDPSTIRTHFRSYRKVPMHSVFSYRRELARRGAQAHTNNSCHSLNHPSSMLSSSQHDRSIPTVPLLPINESASTFEELGQL